MSNKQKKKKLCSTSNFSMYLCIENRDEYHIYA